MTALSDRPDEGSVWRDGWPHVRGDRVALAVVVLLNLSAAAARVGGFALVGVVVDALLAGDVGRVRWAIVASLALSALGMVLTAAGRYLVVRGGENVVARLRERALGAVAAAPLRFLESHRHGELLRRLTGELADLSMFVGGTLPGLLSSVILITVTVVVLAGYSLLLTGILVLLALLTSILLGRQFVARATHAYAERASAEAEVSAIFSESVPAREEIVALGAQGRRARVLAAGEQRLLRARVGELRTELWLLAIGPVGGGLLAVLLGFAALGLQAGWLEVGDAVVFVLAARAAWGDVQDLVAEFGELRAARTGLARVLDLLAGVTPATASAPCAPIALPPRGVLQARAVGFRYPGSGEPAVDAVDVRLDPGERVALVGATGSGKSTLGKLLSGQYQPTTGSVSWGDVGLADVAPEQLRGVIAVVPQEVVLVAGTIAENLAMRGGDVSPGTGEPLAVAAELGLQGWLSTLPAGLDTEVGELGSRLSAGERQLVALWRAALNDPALLVLDEATSDVDPITAGRVENALAHASRGRALLLIAHRADTVHRADRVIALDRGRLCED